jgi:hypothetical protein
MYIQGMNRTEKMQYSASGKLNMHDYDSLIHGQ